MLLLLSQTPRAAPASASGFPALADIMPGGADVKDAPEKAGFDPLTVPDTPLDTLQAAPSPGRDMLDVLRAAAPRDVSATRAASFYSMRVGAARGDEADVEAVAEDIDGAADNASKKSFSPQLMLEDEEGGAEGKVVAPQAVEEGGGVGGGAEAVEPLVAGVEGSGGVVEKVVGELMAQIVPDTFDSSMEVLLSLRVPCRAHFFKS